MQWNFVKKLCVKHEIINKTYHKYVNRTNNKISPFCLSLDWPVRD